jgi:hypothetical protein
MTRGRDLILRWVTFGVRVALTLILVIGPGSVVARGAAAAGFDVSFPNCADGFAGSGAGPAIVGVNGGKAFTQNPCLADQYGRASRTGAAPALYMNLNYPNGPSAAFGQSGPRGACARADAACVAFNYGHNAAQYAEEYARARTAGAQQWWIDVETDNRWSPDAGLNAQVIQGAIAYFQARDLSVGIYSVRTMWHQIAGGFAPKLPLWVAQTYGSIPVLAYCDARWGFGGGQVVMVQQWDGRHDQDVPCPGAPPLAAPVSNGPTPLGARAHGTISGTPGGSSVYYALDYPGGDATRTLYLSFWPFGLDVANGVYLNLYQGGTTLATIHGTDTKAPGQLSVSFSSRAAGPVVVRLTSYGDGSQPPISFDLWQ